MPTRLLDNFVIFDAKDGNSKASLSEFSVAQTTDGHQDLRAYGEASSYSSDIGLEQDDVEDGGPNDLQTQPMALTTIVALSAQYGSSSGLYVTNIRLFYAPPGQLHSCGAEKYGLSQNMRGIDLGTLKSLTASNTLPSGRGTFSFTLQSTPSLFMALLRLTICTISWSKQLPLRINTSFESTHGPGPR